MSKFVPVLSTFVGVSENADGTFESVRMAYPHTPMSAESHRQIDEWYGAQSRLAKVMHEYLYDEAARIAAEALDPMGWFE